MPRYGYTDPAEYYQGTGFDPFTGRLNGGQLVMQVLNQIAGNKRKKKEEAWGLEDRELDRRYKEAQISNLYEVPAPKEVKPTSKIGPQMVKNMMKKLDYPDEVIAEVDTMNEPALAAAWAKTQDDFAARQRVGMRVPRTAASQKGRIQYQQLKSALDTVKARKKVPEGVLIQLQADPDKAMLAGGLVQQLQDQVAKLEEQEGTIASMMNNIDESGELTEEQFKQLNTILKFRATYRPYVPPKPKTEAEKKLPQGFTIQK